MVGGSGRLGGRICFYVEVVFRFAVGFGEAGQLGEGKWEDGEIADGGGSGLMPRRFGGFHGNHRDRDPGCGAYSMCSVSWDILGFDQNLAGHKLGLALVNHDSTFYTT